MSPGALALGVGAALLGVVGIALMNASHSAYYDRTQDDTYGGHWFWLRRSVLNEREYLFNRVGFALAVLALLGLFAASLVR